MWNPIETHPKDYEPCVCVSETQICYARLSKKQGLFIVCDIYGGTQLGLVGGDELPMNPQPYSWAKIPPNRYQVTKKILEGL